MRADQPDSGDARDGRCLISREADASVELASRQVREFVHELSNLVDGSLRSIDLARRDLDSSDASGQRLRDVQRHVHAAALAIGHMASLIRSIYHPLHGFGLRKGATGFDRPQPLGEAIAHAVEVLGPLATERCIGVSVTVAPEAARAPRAPLYPVIANALRNAIDSINHEGQIDIEARIDQKHSGEREVVIEITDDGSGPPKGMESRVFDFGFTTKPGSTGIGLALARDVVNELGGTIELRARWDDAKPRRGAVLTIRLPARSPEKAGREPGSRS